MYKKAAVVVLLMFGSLYLSFALVPQKQNLSITTVDLENSIPKAFANWQEVKLNRLQVINPNENDLVDKLYTKVLERTYSNGKSGAVMLSIAFGDEQRDDMLAHFPEVCYPAQGFNVDDIKTRTIRVLQQNFDVRFMRAQKGDRKEDVTYWLRVGEKIVASRSDQKIASIGYGLKGIIPDGLIFRVSSIGLSNAFEVHQQFINDLFNNIDPVTKRFLIANSLSRGNN